MYTIYQIMPGDTLETLAIKFKTSIENMRMLNNLPFQYQFRPGEQIVVPIIANKPFFHYTVKKGDTMYSIAKRHNVDLDRLLQINGISRNDYIYPGEQIMIPSHEKKTYVVRPGDTLHRVSNELKTDINRLLEDNNDVYLQPGQVLMIKDNPTHYEK